MAILSSAVLDEFVEVHKPKWNYTDPRESINKRKEVIISDGHACWFALVETKHSWSIFMRPVSGWDNDNWPNNWGWIPAPKWTKW